MKRFGIVVALLMTWTCRPLDETVQGSEQVVSPAAYIATADFVHSALATFLVPELEELRVLPVVGPFDSPEEDVPIPEIVRATLVDAKVTVRDFEYGPDIGYLQFVRLKHRSTGITAVEVVSLFPASGYLEDLWWMVLVDCRGDTCEVSGAVPMFGNSDISRMDTPPRELDETRFQEILGNGCEEAARLAGSDHVRHWLDTWIPAACKWSLGDGQG